MSFQEFIINGHSSKTLSCSQAFTINKHVIWLLSKIIQGNTICNLLSIAFIAILCFVKFYILQHWYKKI